MAGEVLSRGLREGHAFVEQAVRGRVDAPPATRLRVAIEAHLVALHHLSDYAGVIAQSVADRTRDSGGEVPDLERRYGGMWLGLLADARYAGALDPGLDLRLVRDLLFGAMNAEPLRGRRPEDAADALAVLIGLS
ncbi:MAG: hypothetical protein L0K86_17995 [Actinomycetia bacterium]|nr:hypothetical protein [Actinomycetes bacterium]